MALLNGCCDVTPGGPLCGVESVSRHARGTVPASLERACNGLPCRLYRHDSNDLAGLAIFLRSTSPQSEKVTR